MNPIKTEGKKMNDILLDTLPIWTTAQALKTSSRGISASNQQLLGIQKLRELILELAVRGKLVPQDPNDEPASELLKRIEREKKRLIKDGKIKKQESLSEVEENEKSFDIPTSWEWVKIGNIGYTQTGGTPSKNDNSLFGNDVPFIKPGDIYPNYVDYNNEGLSFKGVDSLGRSAIEGSILMVCIGTIGKCNLIDRMCAFNQQINSISPYHKISDYILLALRSRYFQNTAWEKSSSTTIAILNKGKWENIGIPLPPLAEQHRIVERVNELMTLCDELEKEQTNSNATHETLLEVLLTNLTDAKNSDDFKEAWQRIAGCFDTLFTTEYSIDKLKQTILQLAVMGKLVPQDPTDEPASELLKKIAKEKARLVKEGKIKKQAVLPEIKEEEKPYELPKGWKWVRFSQIGELARGKSKHRPRNDNSLYENGKYPMVQTGDVTKADRFIKTYTALYNEKGLDQSRLWPKGTMCITIAANIADTSILGFDACFPDSIVGLIVSNEIGDARYFDYFVRTVKDRLTNFAPSTAQKNINLEILESLLIPLPPLHELNLIVVKVDELFAICDSLKVEIRKAQMIQNVLAEVIVCKVVK
ncbi:hypothetical protein SDC9_50216 [bioreactor metagenome]|uniref:Type I restriction modification DNA specificity domain-containing protein n=1 Tax=bioreactor metagenome TaxID=1076179 RepID=A0A644WK10_9ZZZZ